MSVIILKQDKIKQGKSLHIEAGQDNPIGEKEVRRRQESEIQLLPR